MTIVTQQISGQLSPKRVAAYFKKQLKNRDIHVQRCEEDGSAFLLTDGLCTLKVPFGPDLGFFAFGWGAAWERATFEEDSEQPREESGYDQAALWRSWSNTLDNHVLTLSPFLLEIPGMKGKPGELSRQFSFPGVVDDRDQFTPDEVYRTDVYIPKSLTDMLSPDLDELGGFLFETSGKERPIRISAVNGIIGYLMPKCNIERYLSNTW